MTLRDSIRMLRSEVGLTQNELASAVYVSFTTVNRWENQGMRPNRLQSRAILDLAKKHQVSSACLEGLSQCLLASRANDKADKERIQQGSEEIKLEQRDLLTAEQFRKTMDNIDMALIGQRFYDRKPESCDIFYQNSFFIRTLGYTADEYRERVQEDSFFAIAPECRKELLGKFGELLCHRIDLNDFNPIVKAVRKDGTKLWLEIKAASLTEYSYGQELFTSGRDVTKRVEAEQRYKEELLLREVSMQVMFSNIHCDLTQNRVTRYQNLAAVIGKDYEGETLDELIRLVAEAAPESSDRSRYLATFNRDALIGAFDRGEVYGNVVLYNEITHHWFRNEYLLVKNPATGNLHALIYIFDIQKQVLAESMLKLFLDHFFDFVGVIVVDTEMIEPYYYADGVFRMQYAEKRSYAALCAEKLRLYGNGTRIEQQSLAIDLRTVRAMLEKNAFYSTTLELVDYDGKPLRKKITYTYLDETRDSIIVAQSDLAALMRFVQKHKAYYCDSFKACRPEERHEQR